MVSKICVFALVIGFIGFILTLDVFQPYRDSFFSSLVRLLPPEVTAKLQEVSRKADVYYFTKEELSRYSGENEVYIALLGNVFDVSEGKKNYGPEGGYHFFAGKDASRAYVTGDFSEKGLTDNVDGLSHSQLLDLEKWLVFYQRDYPCIGKLIGHFYDENKKPTSALKRLEAALSDAHEIQKDNQDDEALFPSCNSEWSQNLGGRVWCTSGSGGIQRDWVGVPRLYHRPGKSITRCACVRTTGAPSSNLEASDHENRGDLDNPSLKKYPNCNPKAISCKVPD